MFIVKAAFKKRTKKNLLVYGYLENTEMMLDSLFNEKPVFIDMSAHRENLFNNSICLKMTYFE